jgi:DNA-binding transcriptional LysR family regulator
MILPPLHSLRAFEAAARLSSLSRAGAELHVTHAAISHQVRQLEAWLGRRLLQRSGRGVALTAAGEDYFRAVSGALAALSGASVALRRVPDPRSVTVGCIPSIAARWLVPALPEFLALHPETSVRILYARAEEAFDEDVSDVLITLGAPRSPDLDSRRLFSRVNRPVASPHYLAARPELRDPAALVGADLLHDETTGAWEAWFAAAALASPTRLRGPVFQDFNMLATAVIAGHGVALCPVEVFRREIERGDLVVVSDIATLEDQGYFIINRKPAGKTVQKFVNWFAELCTARAR